MANVIIDIYTINAYIKNFIMNLAIYYSCNKIMKTRINKKSHIAFIIGDLLISLMHTFLKPNINAILWLLIMFLVFSMFMSKISKNKIGYSLIVVLVSYAIANVMLLLGTVLGYVQYKVIFDENPFLGMITGSSIQLVLIFLFFKIKRFKNGFGNIYKKFNKDIVDTVVIYLSICVVLIACLMGSMYDVKEERVMNMFISFIILGITMYIMIHRTITMQYKHTLLLKTLEEYKEEIKVKNDEIEKLSAEKFNTSKIRHEFYNRQKALELMVKQTMSKDIDKTDANESILNMVNELTSEYSKECEIIKGLADLPKTDIIEIDNMFKYMQTECAKNNIDFKLNIQDSIHPLVNNYITRSRLETLLGDHIRDAINAINKSKASNKEILVVLGLKDGNYEICIYDTGIEFNIDVLLKLGKEQVTTGGTGIGFITTFETLRETKASLVITEFASNIYTKSVAVIFNNKNEYIINSYRASAIVKENNRNDILINEI